MKKKTVMTTIVVCLLVALVGVVGYTTYARYIASGSGSSAVDIAKWNIEIDGTPVTSASPLTLTKTINWNTSNGLVATGKIAPNMTGNVGLSLGSEGTEVAFDFYVKVEANANLDNPNISIGTIAAGMCSDGVSTNATDCTGDETWTAITLSEELAGTYEGYYKGTVDLPINGENKIAMRASETVFMGLDVSWTDNNNAVANEADTSTGIADPENAAVTFDVVVEQKTN